MTGGARRLTRTRVRHRGGTRDVYFLARFRFGLAEAAALWPPARGFRAAAGAAGSTRRAGRFPVAFASTGAAVSGGASRLGRGVRFFGGGAAAAVSAACRAASVTSVVTG